MNAHVPAPVVLAPVEEAFAEMCEARAVLHVNGYYSLHDAVDGLQAFAERSGLLDLIGQDEAQDIMSRAFCAVDFQPCQIRPVRAAGLPKPVKHRTADSTVYAFWYVVSLKDPAHLKRWLAEHPKDSRYLQKLFEAECPPIT